MAQIDDLKAANDRLVEVVRKLVTVVGEIKAQRDNAITANTDLGAKLDALGQLDDMQAVIDQSHALADEIEGLLPTVAA